MKNQGHRKYTKINNYIYNNHTKQQTERVKFHCNRPSCCANPKAKPAVIHTMSAISVTVRPNLTTTVWEALKTGLEAVS